MAKNIPNLKMKTDTQVHEAQRQRQNKTKPKRPIPRHIIIKMANVKERMLKAKEKELITREPPT